MFVVVGWFMFVACCWLLRVAVVDCVWWSLCVGGRCSLLVACCCCVLLVVVCWLFVYWCYWCLLFGVCCVRFVVFVGCCVCR